MRIRSEKPASEFVVSLEAARQHIRVFEDVEESLLVDYVGAAQGHCEQFLRRSLRPQTWSVLLARFPCKRIFLPHGPVTSIVSVKYRDDTDAEQTIASTNFRLVQNDEIDFIQASAGYTWPTTRSDIEDAVTITYKAGKGDDFVPYQIKAAVMLLAADLHEHREAQSEGVLHENQAVMALLHPFRNYSERYIKQDCCVAGDS